MLKIYEVVAERNGEIKKELICSTSVKGVNKAIKETGGEVFKVKEVLNPVSVDKVVNVLLHSDEFTKMELEIVKSVLTDSLC